MPLPVVERRVARWSVVLVCIAGLLSPAVAAPDDPAARKVEALASEALTAYRAADYNRTVELLERAYQIRQVAALQYNLAKAYDKLGEQDKAIDAYRRYADSTDADPKLRGKAEARIAAYEEAHRPRKDPPRVDDPPPPRHEVAPTGIVKPPVVEGPTPEQLALERWQHRRAHDRKVGIALGAVGVGLALGGIGLSVAAYEGHKDFASSIGTEDQKRSQKTTAQTEAIIGDALYGVAAVSAAVGVYFLWRGYHKEKPPAEARVSLVPLLSPTSAGLFVRGAF